MSSGGAYLSIDYPGSLNRRLGMDFDHFLMVRSRSYETAFKNGVQEVIIAGLQIKLLKCSIYKFSNQSSI